MMFLSFILGVSFPLLSLNSLHMISTLLDYYLGILFLLVDGVEALVNVSRACEVTGVWGGIASQ